MKEALLIALARCRRAQLTIYGSRQAISGQTQITTNAGETMRQWHHPARPAHARIVLWGEFAHVRFRQRKGESMDGMVRRALAELRRRERDGMPTPDAKAKRRRELQKLLDGASGPAM